MEEQESQLNTLLDQEASLPIVDHWKLQLLHRQFQGNRIPGFSTAVQAARMVLKKIPQKKK